MQKFDSKRDRSYRFADFSVETQDKTLWRGETKISVPIKAVEVLTLLIENRGRTVSKNEIMETIWQDTFVDENNLAVMISALRKAFGEGKNDNRFIETVPRRGYRFVHKIADESGLILEKTTITEISVESEENLAIPQMQKHIKLQTAGLLILAVLIFGAVFVFAYVNFFSHKTAETSAKTVTAKPRSLAVLPFNFIGEKKDGDEFLTAGVTDTLTARLAKVKELNVRSASAVFDSSENGKTPLQLGKELQVDSVLTGNFQKFGERIRINLQMLNVSDGSIIWSDSLEENADDIFRLQDNLTAKIVNRLSINLNESQKDALTKKYTTDAEAEKLYIQGRVYWNERNIDDLKKSIEYFERAAQKDPNYALAYVGLADSYQLLAEYKGISTNEAYSKARFNAAKALEIDSELAEAHNSLAYIQAFFDWDFARGETSFKRAIELNPNYATAHHWYSELLNVQHRFDESWRHLQIAHELEPTSASIQGDIPHYYLLRRDYEKAFEEANKMIAKHPQFPYSYMRLYSSNKKLGREKEAAEALGKVHLYFGEDEKLVFERIKAAETGGLKAFWQKALEQSQTQKLKLKPEAIDFALAYLHVGDLDKTFFYLEKSLDERNRWFLEITYDPEWDAIRNDSRYNELIKKAGLNF